MESSISLLQAILQQKGVYERDPCTILNLCPGMPAVTAETPIPDARRNYMRLAVLVHPDKFTARPDLKSQATEGFQVLVKAFERLASPAFRTAAAKKAQPKRSAASSVTKEQKPSKVSKPATKRQSAPKRGKDESSSEGEDSSSDEEEEQETVAAAAKRPPREILDRGRNNNGCCRTVIKCPKCTADWQPDDNRQYSLFMGYGLKVHCQLCLLLFGCATAIHACPGCETSFDYDASEYDHQINCKKCKKRFGFMYYPVTGELVNRIREAEEEEEAKRRNAEEREARARARTGGDVNSGTASAAVGSAGGAFGGRTEDEFLSLVGSCAVNEECPLCGKKVASRHRTHVEACIKNPPPPKKQRQVRKFIEDDDSDGSDGGKRKRTTLKKKAPPKKRGRKDYSDSD